MVARNDGAKPPRRRKRYYITGISFRVDQWEFLTEEERSAGICPSVTIRMLIDREMRRRTASAARRQD